MKPNMVGEKDDDLGDWWNGLQLVYCLLTEVPQSAIRAVFTLVH